LGKITLVTGGGRSGKSCFAEKLASRGVEVVYVATSIVFDEEMEDRVRIHKRRRPSNWKTIEKYKKFTKQDFEGITDNDVIMVDCLTLMINNLFFDEGCDYNTISMTEYNDIESRIFKEIDQLSVVLKESKGSAVIVTNEVGSGIIPENRFARLYRDTVGRANIKIAGYSNEVFLVVCGLPVKVK